MSGKLIFFAGKMGAGKSTYALKLKDELNAVLLVEDNLLSQLYPNEIDTMQDYVKYSSRLKRSLKNHIHELLNKGNTVILDFPGNTVKQRVWFKSILDNEDYEHTLYYLNIDNDLCLKHLEKRRREQPDRNAFDTEEVFHYVTQYFEPPKQDEHFNVIEINNTINT